MKSTKKHLLILGVSIAAAFTACDYVNVPYPTKNVNAGDTSLCTSPTFTDRTPVKKILIEDYTAHLCTNCPRAEIELPTIFAAHPDKIVAIAVHCGDLATPCPPHGLPNGSAPAGSYYYDFRTTAGKLYDDFFGASAKGQPQGMVNRKDYNVATQTHLKGLNSIGDWKNIVDGIAGNAPVIDIQIINDFDGASKRLCTHVKTKFLTPLTGNYKLAVLLTQDSITGWQLDKGNNKQYYTHRHVLRDAITNSAWGETIASGTINASTSVITKYAYIIPSSFKSLVPGGQAISDVPCDINHCHVVAFVYDSSTYEILQVEEKGIK